jgi:hypothetical protein
MSNVNERQRKGENVSYFTIYFAEQLPPEGSWIPDEMRPFLEKHGEIHGNYALLTDPDLLELASLRANDELWAAPTSTIGSPFAYGPLMMIRRANRTLLVFATREYEDVNDAESVFEACLEEYGQDCSQYTSDGPDHARFGGCTGSMVIAEVSLNRDSVPNLIAMEAADTEAWSHYSKEWQRPICNRVTEAASGLAVGKRLTPIPASINGVGVDFAGTVNTLVEARLVASLNHTVHAGVAAGHDLKRIFVSSANDSHSPPSRHAMGKAVDISRINGHKISVAYERDESVTAITRALQEKFESYEHRRENFGPHLKKKLGKDHDVLGHEDHVHFSVN